jgi:hypothetical protein
MIRKKQARIYKVTCRFYVRAKDKNDVEQHIIDEESINEFIDSHVIVKEATVKVDLDDLWRIYCERDGCYGDVVLNKNTNEFVCEECGALQDIQFQLKEKRQRKNVG